MIDFDEFVYLMTRKITNTEQDDYRKAFELFDEDEDGFLCHSEIKQVSFAVGSHYNTVGYSTILHRAQQCKGNINICSLFH